MIKLPFNWAGNKVYYMEYVNTLLIGRQYDRVIDAFLGSGHLLLNVQCQAKEYIGNDILKLIPEILEHLSNTKEEFTYEDVKELDDKWKFNKKEDYYLFRDVWNQKYTTNTMDKQFIIATVMLLKMCNNSVVRFNQKGEFNQGFRGLAASKTKEGGIGKFFVDSSFVEMASSLNNLNKVLMHRRYKFYNKDFMELLTELDTLKNNNTKEITDTFKDLVILDPPYLLSNTSTYGGTYKTEQEDKLLEYIDGLGVGETSKADFILFNYLNNCDVEHTKLNELIERNKYKVITLSTKGKLKNIASNTNTLREVLITNII